MTESLKTINVLIDNIDPFRGIRGNITNDDDTFYMELISKLRKFTILGHVDSVVIGLEFITCQLKQFIS